MRSRAVVMSLLVLTLVFPRAAFAAQSQSQPQHIADAAALKNAVTAKVAVDRENRQVVLKVLDRKDVKTVADKMGLDVKRARTAVTTLEGAQLADLAELARNADKDLAGGNKTITISVTTLLLILILIVLLVD